MLLSAQKSENYELWKSAVQKHKEAGTFQGFHGDDDFDDGLKRLEKNGANCPEVDQGFGTPGWTPSSSIETDNADPACILPNDVVECNGGKYRVAFRNVIFECPNWQGDNYLESGSGFRPLTDDDLNARFAQLNAVLANANIELVEVERSRITDCDMYDFYFKKWGKDPSGGFNDGVNDEDEINGFDETNVLNLYWVGGFNNNHGCCGPLGFIDKLPTPLDYGVMRYSAAMNESSMEHDIAHFFGIYHPHWDLEAHENIKVGYPDGELDNSDCRTHGDGVCDTWPGAALEYKCDQNCQNGTDKYCYQGNNCSFNMANYQCVNGHQLQIHPDEGTQIDDYTSTILSYNYATYNSDECRQNFTPCQYYKMNLIARSCRSHLCIQEYDQYFYSQADYEKEISDGDAIPTFIAGRTHTAFDGSTYDVDCFNWYLNEDDLDAQAVVRNSNSFDPAAYVNGEGTYTFYMAEVNALNDPPCKLPIQLVVGEGFTGGNDCNNPLPGSTVGTTDQTFTNAMNTLDLATSGANLSGEEEVLWWITRTQSAKDNINGGSSLESRLDDAVISPANDGSAIIGNASVIFSQSEIENGALIDCANLTSGEDYYATPFVGTITETTTGGGCGNNGSSNSCSGSFDYASSKHKGDPLRVAIMPSNTLSCATNDAPTYTLTVDVSGYTGSSSNFRMYIVHSTSKSLVKLIKGGGNGILNFTEADLDNYDPNSEGIRVAVLEENGEGGKDVDLEVSLDITYGNDDGGDDDPIVTEISVDASYSNCLFGTPVVFRCAENLDNNALEGRSGSIHKGISIYPSPNDGNQINLILNITRTADLQIGIYDVNGRLINQREQSVVIGTNKLTLDLPNLTDGIYLSKTTQNGIVEHVRFSVAR